jgi:hypothetical protein
MSFVPRSGSRCEMLGNGSEMLNLSVNGMRGLVCVNVASFTAQL